MAAWRYEISPCGHVVSSIYLPVNKERREVRKGRRERHLADFIFKMARRVMADDYHIYITTSYPDVFLSPCQFTRKGRREVSPPWSNKTVLPAIF